MKLKLLKSKKGQAFSTFQLLIAAVVALAILGILLPMLVDINIGANPIDKIQEKLKEVPEQPATLTYSETLEFSKDNLSAITAKTAIKGSGMASEQLLFGVFDSDKDDFEIEEGRLIVKTNEPVKFKIGFLCDESYSELEDDISTMYSDELDDLDYQDSKRNSLDEDARTCIVFPKKE